MSFTENDDSEEPTRRQLRIGEKKIQFFYFVAYLGFLGILRKAVVKLRLASGNASEPIYQPYSRHPGWSILSFGWLNSLLVRRSW